MSRNSGIIMLAWVAVAFFFSTGLVNASVIELTGGDPGDGLTVPFLTGNPTGTYDASGIPTNGFTPGVSPYTYAYFVPTPFVSPTQASTYAVQTVTFTKFGTDAHTSGGSPDITITDGAPYGFGLHSFGGSDPNGYDSNLSRMTAGIHYVTDPTIPIIVTIDGLQSGKSYQVDFITGDPNQSPDRGPATFTFTGGATDTFDEFNGHVYDVSETVTAVSSQIIVTLSGSLNPEFSAFAVSASIPEPASMSVLLVGGLALLGVRGRRRV